MRTKQLTASQALAAVSDGDGDSRVPLSAFICPHPACHAHSVHYWGTVSGLKVYGGNNSFRNASPQPKVLYALCQACNQEVIYLNGKLIFPEESDAPLPAADLPSEVLEDYNEARGIVLRSPRGAAALLRLVVQKLLPLLGATKAEINAGIGELVEKGIISPAIQQALDSVRVIGNEAVHPGELDLKDDGGTALSLFQLINFIVEKAITEPKEVAAIYANLPAKKLAGIATRDDQKKTTD